jgi:hypothetical protein
MIELKENIAFTPEAATLFFKFPANARWNDDRDAAG